MKYDEQGRIVEATEGELFDLYLSCGWDDVMDFREYKRRMKASGVAITDEDN